MLTLKQARRSAGLTQEEVAKVLHLAPPTVSAHENGKNKPKIDTLASYARLYGLDAGEIFLGTEDEVKRFDKQKREQALERIRRA